MTTQELKRIARQAIKVKEQADSQEEIIAERENPWPNGPVGRLYPILSIGLNRSGVDSMGMDFSINTAAVRRMVETGRMDELMETIEEMKESVTLTRAIEGDLVSA